MTKELGQAHVGGDFTCRSGEVAAELELLAVSCKADLVVVGRSTHPASISAASRDNYSLGGAAQSSSCPKRFHRLIENHRFLRFHRAFVAPVQVET